VWTGCVTAQNGYLEKVCTGTGDGARTPVAIDSNVVNLSFDWKIQGNINYNCQGMAVYLESSPDNPIVTVSPDFCYPWNGIFSYTIYFDIPDVGYHTQYILGQRDNNWHNLKLSIDHGLYTVYHDGTPVIVASGTSRINSSWLSAQGWTHSGVSGSGWDNFKVGITRSQAINIDKTPPATTIAPSGSTGNNGWYTSDVQVTLTATDNEGGSGVKNTEYSFDGTNWNLYTVPFTITNEGTTIVYYRSTDNAGNIELTKTQTVKIDKTPPVIAGVPLVSKFSDDFNDNDISDWTMNANGNADAIADNGRMRLRVYKCSNVNVYKDLGFVSGEITVDFDFETRADGWHEIPDWKLIIDGVPMEGPYLPIPAYSGTTGHVTKTVTVNGNTQLAFLAYPSSYCGNGDHGNTYLWVDNVVVKTVADANSWYNKDVVVRFAASDDISGIDTVTPDTIISTEGAAQSATGTAVDKAGNSNSTTVSGINIDKTPPQVTINIPASGGVYLLNQALTADWSATDSLSGIASATGTLPSGAAIDTSMAGTKTFTVVATDIAGNTATQTSSYTIAYNFLGILPPIRADGSSIFNLGSTVPVKFRIADANGNYVSTATANLTYQYITGDVLGTVKEPISTSAANEGNTFRYDSTDNLYIFNLGTEGMATGTYQLNINLDDGTTHTVRISLR